MIVARQLDDVAIGVNAHPPHSPLACLKSDAGRPVSCTLRTSYGSIWTASAMVSFLQDSEVPPRRIRSSACRSSVCHRPVQTRHQRPCPSIASATEHRWPS